MRHVNTHHYQISFLASILQIVEIFTHINSAAVITTEEALLTKEGTSFSAYCVCSLEGQEFILAGKKIRRLYEQEILFKREHWVALNQRWVCTFINEALTFENITIL